MKLYSDILAHALSQLDAQIIFPDLHLSAKEIVEMQCYKALDRIRSIIRNSELDDDECCMKIEEIICVLEEIGTDGGVRHDYG